MRLAPIMAVILVSGAAAALAQVATAPQELKTPRNTQTSDEAVPASRANGAVPANTAAPGDEATSATPANGAAPIEPKG